METIILLAVGGLSIGFLIYMLVDFILFSRKVRKDRENLKKFITKVDKEQDDLQKEYEKFVMLSNYVSQEDFNLLLDHLKLKIEQVEAHKKIIKK